MYQQRRDLLAQLGHARERRDAARKTVDFYQARKREIADQLTYAEEELRELVEELDGEAKPADRSVGVHDRSKDVVRRLAD